MKKKYKKETYKTKKEWLANRGIGGSDIATILGKSKWQTIDDLYSRLVYGRTKNKITTSRMQEGIDAEPLIRNLFALEHPEFKVKNPPKSSYWLFRSLDNDLIICSPDGLMTDEDGNLYGLEIKDCELIKREERELWENNELPQYYFLQLIQYLIVFNDMKGVCLHARLKYFKFVDDKPVYDYCVERNYWVYRDEVLKEIEYVKKKEIDFIVNNVLIKKRPTLKIEL